MIDNKLLVVKLFLRVKKVICIIEVFYEFVIVLLFCIVIFFFIVMFVIFFLIRFISVVGIKRIYICLLYIIKKY